MLKPDLSSVINDLNIVADYIDKYELTSPIGPWVPFVYTFQIDTTKLTIKCFWHPESIRLRIFNLKKDSSKLSNGLSKKIEKVSKC